MTPLRAMAPLFSTVMVKTRFSPALTLAGETLFFKAMEKLPEDYYLHLVGLHGAGFAA